jgi:hypothetical protein
MYTEFVCDQLAFAHDKEYLNDKKVIEVGSSQWDSKYNRYMKARLPGFMLAQSTTEMFSRLNAGQYTSYPSDKDIAENTTADIVCSFGWMQTRVDPLGAFSTLHDLTNPGGLLILNCPLGITSAMSTMTVNQLIHIRHANKYECPYLTIANHSIQFKTRLDSKGIFNNKDIKELLYKFRETPNLAVGVIFKKTSLDSFKY